MKINDGASPGLSPNLDSNPSHNRTMGQLLFRSNVLPFGTHTLTIEQQGGDPIWLDYFLVKPGTADDVAAYRAAHPVKTNLAADSERSTMPKGAVLGVVIGAVVGVACILLLFFFVRRRRGKLFSQSFFVSAHQSQQKGNKMLIISGLSLYPCPVTRKASCP